MVAVKIDARSTEYIDALLWARSVGPKEKVLRGRWPSWQDLSCTSYEGFRIQLSLLTLTSYQCSE